jgi:hypothetical protein
LSSRYQTRDAVHFQQSDTVVDRVIAGADQFGVARDIRDRHARLTQAARDA